MYYPKNEVLHDKSVPLKFSLPISQKSNVSNFGVIVSGCGGNHFRSIAVVKGQYSILRKTTKRHVNTEKQLSLQLASVRFCNSQKFQSLCQPGGGQTVSVVLKKPSCTISSLQLGHQLVSLWCRTSTLKLTEKQ